jgi:hypothetical protein
MSASPLHLHALEPGTDVLPATPIAPAPTVPPLLLDIKALSALLSRSVPSLWRDDAAGRLPASVRVGVSKRWRRTSSPGSSGAVRPVVSLRRERRFEGDATGQVVTDPWRSQFPERFYP